MNAKRYLPVVLLVVTLHYIYLAAMSSRITWLAQSFLVLTTLLGAGVVFVLSGFGEDGR